MSTKAPTQLQLLRELISLDAFRPDVFDMTVPLSARFAGEKILALSLYPDAVRWAEVGFGGRVRVRELGSTTRRTGTTEELVNILREIAASARGLHVAVTYNFGFSAVKSSALKRNSQLWVQLKNRPESVLGADYEPGHAYSVVLHPTLDCAVVFSYNLGIIAQIEQALTAADLSCVRLQNTMGSLFAAACRQCGGGPTDPLLLLAGNSVLFLDVGPPKEHEWIVLRSRAENAELRGGDSRKPLAYLSQILPHRGRLFVCSDAPSTENEWETRIREMRPDLTLAPVFEAKAQNVSPAYTALIAD